MFKNKSNNICEQNVKVLGVDFRHMQFVTGDDLYLTEFGMPMTEILKPENFWTDNEWLNKNSIRLSGTSCAYKITTKTINGINKDIVLKWNRMGQDIPFDLDSDEILEAEFNSPFEEFSLVIELRNIMYSEDDSNIIIQKPLAIYVPAEKRDFWKTGRTKQRMKNKIKMHKEIMLDMNRSYAVIYEWIPGIDAAFACRKRLLNENDMRKFTTNAEKEIEKYGFIVNDRKPHHVIVNPLDFKDLHKTKHNNIVYGLVDFELLSRMSSSEEAIKINKRIEYLKRQKDRFRIKIPINTYPQLKYTNIFGVDYIYGSVESTKGKLWVVGRDPNLFDYFLPEKWELTPKIKLSEYSEVYSTITKDNIHLVWRLSNVGMQPDLDPFKRDEKKLLDHGFNSPFEEIYLAIELNKRGFPTIYPRAIYMMGNDTDISDYLLDTSRYESHKNYKTSGNLPILMKNHDYIIIWGYWNGPDEKLAVSDKDHYEGIDLLKAYRKKIISKIEYIRLLKLAKKRLSKIGIIDLNLRGNHILISFDESGNLIKNKRGIPELRICNFEFLYMKNSN